MKRAKAHRTNGFPNTHQNGQERQSRWEPQGTGPEQPASLSGHSLPPGRVTKVTWASEQGGTVAENTLQARPHRTSRPAQRRHQRQRKARAQGARPLSIGPLETGSHLCFNALLARGLTEHTLRPTTTNTNYPGRRWATRQRQPRANDATSASCLSS